MGKNNFLFPHQDHFEMIKNQLAEIGGSAVVQHSDNHKNGQWEAEIHTVSGSVFEKATVARIDLCGGSVEDTPADITVLQAFAWPANPRVPGIIIMASASSTEGGDPIITFFTDLIMQSGTVRQEDKDAFTARLAETCLRHNEDIAEFQALMAGRGMLGECAAECGMLYFFEQCDSAMLADMMQAALNAYEGIACCSAAVPAPADFISMELNRKKIVNWMLTQDYGVKVSRQNNIPIEVIETYAYPPMANSPAL